MFEIPLPFVVALLLAILLVRLILRGPGGQIGRSLRIFVAASLALVVMVGLRWQFDLMVFRFLRPLCAAMLPPIAWMCFAALGAQEKLRSRWTWMHIIPVLIIFIASVTWSRWHIPVDFLISVQFSGYGIALMVLASRGEDHFAQARLGDVGSVRGIVAVVGGALIFSALVDGLIALDFRNTQGTHAAAIVGYGQLVVLVVLAILMTRLGRLSPQSVTSDGTGTAPAQDHDRQADQDIGEDDAILAAIDDVVIGQHLYRDPDLTLDRLARRAVIPARQISGAINRRFGRNVSQVVNEYRIAEAQSLLRKTEKPVTEIMFECGFQTKSNFNREFLRVTGMGPRAYRTADPHPDERQSDQPFGPIRKLFSQNAGSRE
ncbi:helix-turn-helix transcriptional regulator [Thalassospira sp. HF15]|uniref:helix-turn-helix domain-containing protein n=1 Tax=Thalassospira sp. HF15 TaxID=2722755 RepID=UPI0014308FDE|nr:AraC family transcriptional regulator [Thalassospira sp. HF15]NIY74805.1 helix-turn-helix transcriptional regulator [Thalassospira sp. HF15]